MRTADRGPALDSVELQSLTGRGSAAAARAEPAAAAAAARDPDIRSFQGYTSPLWRRAAFAALGVGTGGATFLAAAWSLRVRVALTLQPCALAEAEVAVVTLTDGRADLARVRRLPSFASIDVHAAALGGGAPAPGGIGLGGGAAAPKGDGLDRLLEFRCARYLYSHAAATFLPVPGTPPGFQGELAAGAAARRVKGQLGDEWARAARAALYGPNELAVPVKSRARLVAEEMVHPFYVFQYASVLIWCLEAYYSYSLIIVSITLASILFSAAQAHAYMARLAALARFECEVTVVGPGGALAPTSSAALVPGDVVVVRPGPLPCDLVLLRGEAIVDETMLTGEAVPVRKVAWAAEGPGAGGAPPPAYDPDVHKACTLYGGTVVAQARPGGAERLCLAAVARTGFWTAKGALLKSILHPRAHRESFARDAMAFIGAMLALGAAFYAWDVLALASYGAPAGFIVLRYLDLVTVAVPPALPACLTVATAIAVARLARHEIFVSNPAAIALAGHLDIICFDKTGTLTEPGLDLMGVVPVEEEAEEAEAAGAAADGAGAGANGGLDSGLDAGVRPAKPGGARRAAARARRCGALAGGAAGGALPPAFQEALATCHGLAQLDGALVGDPLDQRLFAATGWRMLDDGAGAPVEIVAFADENHDLFVPSSPTLGGAPRARQPGSPGALVTAHVATRVAPPAGAAPPPGARTIVRRFEFSSETQRAVVVVRRPDGSLHACAKGSPEAIRRLADPATLPADYDAVLGGHAREGLRVIAVGARPLGAMTEAAACAAPQAELEAGLAFIGFAVMANPLRGDSAEALAGLHAAGVRTVMVTGDHASTAISVAHSAGMLRRGAPTVYFDTASPEGRVRDGALALAAVSPDGAPFAAPPAALLAGVAGGALEGAVTGRGFERLVLEADDADAELAAGGGAGGGGGGLDTALHRAGVFARMSPDDKRLLVELLGEGTAGADEGGGGGAGGGRPGLGHHVGFCGDGANDVGALRAAHVGVSLCEAEASVAAPLTSRRPTIACMLAVVAEGRASLAASYAIFKFVVVYAFVQVRGGCAGACSLSLSCSLSFSLCLFLARLRPPCAHRLHPPRAHHHLHTRRTSPRRSSSRSR
jgi:cation-transporting ATPase 13A3/4/5